ncbi:vacuolar protein sorting-associated protein VTA1 homolog [Pollicipes pollicipes]|uniref:vacuolar protein sorting-associated protein VTA1 homolog n=1 Tax=Pollicipes pollicipes TaxID=41117 RepID=UPI001884C66C|nr:vacuolar protein sorting-associated protein VTA1 homolog [Pollicipes pollicipes]
MALHLPAVPPILKPIQHFLKVAAEHERRDPVVTYWSRLYALQNGLQIDKSAESLAILLPLMDWLENAKKSGASEEAITNDVVAQAHMENCGNRLFLWADKEDRAAHFNKNVVKAFYTAGVIYDVCETFGELSVEVQEQRKYAKWKAAYIHSCLKKGETPQPGPVGGDDEEDLAGDVSMPVPQQPHQPGPGPSGPNVMGFQPPPPAASPAPAAASSYQPPAPAPAASSGSSVSLNFDQIAKAQKYSKLAYSALNYEDVPTAVVNLQKALHLLQTGVDA